MMMKLQSEVAEVSTVFEQICHCLPMADGEKLVELGCGRAETTLLLAEKFPQLEIVATEVDEVQHAKNLALPKVANLTFQYGGADKIDLPDDSANYIMMLKSLHHVPLGLMEQSLEEIWRVLVPGGLLFVAEPVYAGDFNEILRLFHDEKEVRSAAFTALCRAVDSAKFELVEQVFFDDLLSFEGFAEYEERILGVTHSVFNIDEQLLAKVKSAFDSHLDGHGVAKFRSPIRVDLLRRVATG